MSTELMAEREHRSQSQRYKFQRLRERLRIAVESGELSGKLPGERELARRYEVNAKTVNKALCDLATDGLVVRHVGRGTFVARGGSAGQPLQTKSLHFGWMTPPGTGCTHRPDLFGQAEAVIRQHGHRLSQLAWLANAGEWPPASPLLLRQLRKLGALVFFSCRPSTELLADLLRRHLPVVVVNNCHEAIRTSVVRGDLAQGAFELTQQAVHLGHQEIELLIDPEGLPAARAAEAGYRAAMQRYGRPARTVRLAGPTFDWTGLLQGSNRPTALICVGAGPAVEAARRALEAGLTLPSMLSISAVPEPGDPLPAEHSITAYEVDAGRIVHWTTELLLSASPGQPPRLVIVPGRLTDRGSAAPPGCGHRHTVPLPTETMV